MEPTARSVFVGMFDVLGFKALRDEHGTAGLHRLYMNGFVPAVQHAAATRKKVVGEGSDRCVVPDTDSWRVEVKIFSDTAVLVTADDSVKSFHHIVTTSFELLKFGLAGARMPLRGAIGYGDVITSPPGVLIGSAVEDAYLGEQSQVWAGCALTQKCREFVEGSGYLKTRTEMLRKAAAASDQARTREILELHQRLLPEYDVPCQHNPKDGPIEYTAARCIVVDWTLQVYEGAAQRAFLGARSPHDQRKIDNTVAFEAWARENNRALLNMTT